MQLGRGIVGGNCIVGGVPLSLVSGAAVGSP
jgi:hypothetical protein